MLVPETADGLRTSTSGLLFLGEIKGVTFHTFSLPEIRCVRLLSKNLDKVITESEIREELETLHMHVEAVIQLRSRIQIRTPRRNVP